MFILLDFFWLLLDIYQWTSLTCFFLANISIDSFIRFLCHYSLHRLYYVISHLTLFHLALFHLALFHLTLFHLTLFHLTLFHLTLFHLTLFHLIHHCTYLTSPIDKHHRADKVVPASRAQAFADLNEIQFIETSAKNNINVEEAFTKVIDEIYLHLWLYALTW